MRLTVWLWMWLLMLEPCLARANDTNRAPRPTINVVVAGPAHRSTALAGALSDPFGRAGIELAVRQVPDVDLERIVTPDSADQARIRLWFDLTESTTATLLLSDARRERVYVRTFQLARGLDEIALEELVVAARSSVEALLGGATIGVRRQDFVRSLDLPASAKTEASDAAPRRARARGQTDLILASHYEAGLLTTQSISHGPGLSVRLDRGSVALGASLIARLPSRHEGQHIGVRLTSLGARLVALGERNLDPRWTALGGIGLGTDLTLVQPLALSSRAAALPARSWVFDPALRGFAGFRYRWSAVWLGAFTGLELLFIRARYTVDHTGSRETLLMPLTWRPIVGIELATGL